MCVGGKQGLGFLDLPQAIAARTISEVGQWISDGIVFLFLSSACLAKCFFLLAMVQTLFSTQANLLKDLANGRMSLVTFP